MRHFDLMECSIEMLRRLGLGIGAADLNNAIQYGR
jgi:hypothetical protein